MKDYFVLALKNIRRKGIRTWLTLLGILIGIAAVVSLISLGGGLKMAVNSQFGLSSTELITVEAGGITGLGPPGIADVNPLTIQDVEAIEKLSSVERAIRRNLPSGKLEFRDEVGFGIAMSIPDGDDRKFAYEQLDFELEEGRLLKDGDNKKVVLGYNFFAEDAGFRKKIRAGNNILLQDQEFEVVGITKKKGSFILDNIVHVNDKPLEDLMGYGDDVDLIAVKVKNKDLVERAKVDIEKLLRKRRDVKVGEEDFSVSTPEAALDNVNQILSGVQAFIVIIAFMSIVVGVIGIANTMTTSVIERKNEIGIMKAIGARNEDIFYQFLIEAGLLGLIGGIIGVVLGMGMGYIGTNALNNFLGASTSPEFNIPLIFSGRNENTKLFCVSGKAAKTAGIFELPAETKINDLIFDPPTGGGGVEKGKIGFIQIGGFGGKISRPEELKDGIIASGAAAHSDHGRDIAHTLIMAAKGEAHDYELKGTEKLKRMAAAERSERSRN